jgi:hypothetical protein
MIDKKKIIIILLIFAYTGIFAQDYPQKLQWGLGFDDLSKQIPSEIKQTVFTPKQKPEYSNKILSFITAIDESYNDKIKILKAVSTNTTDFLFFNNKLYSTLIEWESIDEKSMKKIETELQASFGQPAIQQSENLMINSYANSTTKVLLYKKKTSDGKWSCRVYYYAKKLFKMLILE